MLLPGKHTKSFHLPKPTFSVSRLSTLNVHTRLKSHNQLNQNPPNLLNISKLIVCVKRQACNVNTPVVASTLVRNLQTAKTDNTKEIEPTNGTQTTTPTIDNSNKSNSMSPLELLEAYASLGKVKLSALVIVTTMVGYFMAPTAFVTAPFVWSSLGTFYCCDSSNPNRNQSCHCFSKHI